MNQILHSHLPRPTNPRSSAARGGRDRSTARPCARLRAGSLIHVEFPPGRSQVAKGAPGLRGRQTQPSPRASRDADSHSGRTLYGIGRGVCAFARERSKASIPIRRETPRRIARHTPNQFRSPLPETIGSVTDSERFALPSSERSRATLHETDRSSLPSVWSALCPCIGFRKRQ